MQPDHQPGEDRFRAIRHETIDWKPFSAFPPAARLAVLVGNPPRPGPYVIRVKLPTSTKPMPHRNPEDRIDTVVSGMFQIGLGQEFHEEGLLAFGPGSVVVQPSVSRISTTRNRAHTLRK
jgi:hypothetical protein